MDGRAAESCSPPALRTDSVLVLDVPVFGHRLMVMTALAKGLPVRFVPEQFLITAMRFDMVNDRCRDETAFCFAADAPGMTFQEKLPSLLPLPSVTTCFCISPVALHCRSCSSQYFLPYGTSLGQPGYLQGVFGLLGIYIISGIKKGPMAFKPRSFILFLLIIVYLTEACDIKCCFSDIQ